MSQVLRPIGTPLLLSENATPGYVLRDPLGTLRVRNSKRDIPSHWLGLLPHLPTPPPLLISLSLNYISNSKISTLLNTALWKRRSPKPPWLIPKWCQVGLIQTFQRTSQGLHLQWARPAPSRQAAGRQNPKDPQWPKNIPKATSKNWPTKTAHDVTMLQLTLPAGETGSFESSPRKAVCAEGGDSASHLLSHKQGEVVSK